MNPRNTMGRHVMALRRFAAPGKVVTLVLVSPVQLKKLGLKSFQGLEGLLQNRLPLQLQGQPRARIADGAVCLTDPVRARQCVALLLVGEEGYSWATSLMNEASGTA